MITLFMARVKDLFALHPPSQADFPRFPVFLRGSKSGGNSRAGRFPARGTGLPQGRGACPHASMAAAPRDETSKWVFLSPRSLIPPSCCLFAGQQLREDNSVMKELPPNFQVWPTRSIRHFGKIKNFISNQPAFICLGINKAEEPAVATAAS